MRCFGRLKYQKNGPLASETGKETSPPAPAGFSRRVRALWRVSLPSGFFRCRADFGPDGSRFFPVASDGAPACRACRYGAAATRREGARRFSPFPNGLRRRLRSRCLSSRTKSTARTPERFPDGGAVVSRASLPPESCCGREALCRRYIRCKTGAGARFGIREKKGGEGRAERNGGRACGGSVGHRRVGIVRLPEERVWGRMRCRCPDGGGGSVGWRLLNGGSVP